jgi:hypothetical protein
MNEFAQLLKDAAGQPPRPLNMVAVRQRAARQGRRRRAGVWLWAAVAALGIGVPTGVSLVPSGDRPTDVRSIENDRDTRRPPAPDPTGDPDLGGAPQEPVRNASTAGSDGAHRQAVTPAASPTLPTATTTATTKAAGYPPMTSCSVYSDGLVDDNQRSCRFTATQPGGWNFYQRELHTPRDIPDTWVSVTRDGHTKEYRTTRTASGNIADGCDDGVIEPGDLVEVVVGPPSRWLGEPNEDAGVGAGAGWGCAEPGPPA